VFLNTATYRYAHGGLLDLPMVVRMACGGGGFGPEHSQSTEAYLMHTPGLRVCLPSTAYDAKGLTLARDPIERSGFRAGAQNASTAWPTTVPEDDYVVEFGRARVRRVGTHVTIVAWQDMLRRALVAADELSDDGIEVEIIDPLTLNPLDVDTIVASVRKTGACVVVEEAPRTGGVGAEIGAVLMEHAFGYLDKPLRRLAIPDTPVPMAEHLVDALAPSTADIVTTIRELMR
jgi:pyruvate dehydrogenase E1 component beta subunit